MPDKPAGPENNRAQARAEAHAQESAQTLRLDKWLWFARFCKTRTLAANLCRSGRVRINKTPTEKPNHQIRPGDILTFPQADWVRVVKVVGLGERRGPAPEAALLYEDMTPPRSAAETRVAPRSRGAGRPTKRDRRSLERLRRDPSL